MPVTKPALETLYIALWGNVIALLIGLPLYILYGYAHSTLRRGTPPVPIEPPPPIVP